MRTPRPDQRARGSPLAQSRGCGDCGAPSSGVSPTTSCPTFVRRSLSRFGTVVLANPLATTRSPAPPAPDLCLGPAAGAPVGAGALAASGYADRSSAASAFVPDRSVPYRALPLGRGTLGPLYASTAIGGSRRAGDGLLPCARTRSGKSPLATTKASAHGSGPGVEVRHADCGQAALTYFR